MLRRVEAIDTELRQIFARVLHRRAGVVLRGVTIERDRRDMMNIRAEFYLGPQRGAERYYEERRAEFPPHLQAEWRRVKSQASGRVSYDADVLWSEMVENWRMERELFRIRDALEVAHSTRAPQDQIAMLTDVYQQRRDTYLRNHHMRQGPVDQQPYENAYAQVGRYTHHTYNTEYLQQVPVPDRQTATEVQERLRQQQAAYEQRYLQAQAQQMASENAWRQQGMITEYIFNSEAIIYAPRGHDAEAQKRALQLLKENLTPAQLAQYEKDKHFDVRGGTTGKTYRINHGRQMNINELGADGKAVKGWCFLPAGNLVEGDVMLAQKNALELFETEALKVANPFAVNGSQFANDMFNTIFQSFTEIMDRGSEQERQDTARYESRTMYGLGRLMSPRGFFNSDVS